MYNILPFGCSTRAGCMDGQPSSLVSTTISTIGNRYLAVRQHGYITTKDRNGKPQSKRQRKSGIVPPMTTALRWSHFWTTGKKTVIKIEVSYSLNDVYIPISMQRRSDHYGYDRTKSHREGFGERLYNGKGLLTRPLTSGESSVPCSTERKRSHQVYIFPMFGRSFIFS